jgi:hypothetical protein
LIRGSDSPKASRVRGKGADPYFGAMTEVGLPSTEFKVTLLF